MLSWWIGGTEYTLDDFTYGNTHEHLGFGLPTINRLEERGPLQNGVTDRGYRLEPRVITLIMGVWGSDLDEYYNKRSLLLDAFKPSNTAGKLRFTRGGIVREIQGFTFADSLMFSGNRERIYQKVAVSIRCPDPRWYDPTINSENFNLAGGSDTLEIPLEIPFTLGASTIDSTKAIVYAGNVKSYPTIRVTGPITDPVITNVETGLKLDFTGITISAGITYIIDLGYADNTVETSTGTNKISELTTDSDLVEFCIDPAYGGGSNNINVTGTSITEATNIRISYYDYYIGV